MTAAAQAIAKELQRTSGEIRNNIIYARIDELDEAALDVLAHDLHVDWYDFNYPIEVKRATIRDSIKDSQAAWHKVRCGNGAGERVPRNEGGRMV